MPLWTIILIIYLEFFFVVLHKVLISELFVARTTHTQREAQSLSLCNALRQGSEPYSTVIPAPTFAGTGCSGDPSCVNLPLPWRGVQSPAQGLLLLFLQKKSSTKNPRRGCVNPPLAGGYPALCYKKESYTRCTRLVRLLLTFWIDCP